jgi:hypothetical protein
MKHDIPPPEPIVEIRRRAEEEGKKHKHGGDQLKLWGNENPVVPTEKRGEQREANDHRRQKHAFPVTPPDEKQEAEREDTLQNQRQPNVDPSICVYGRTSGRSGHFSAS